MKAPVPVQALRWAYYIFLRLWEVLKHVQSVPHKADGPVL